MEQNAKPVAKGREQMKKKCSYCDSSHPNRQCLAYGRCVENAEKNQITVRQCAIAIVVEGTCSM